MGEQYEYQFNRKKMSQFAWHLRSQLFGEWMSLKSKLNWLVAASYFIGIY